MERAQISLIRSRKVITRNGPADIRGRLWDVLEALALKPGTGISSDDLARKVWGDSPPPSADVTLRGLIADLRRALGDDDRTLIVTVPGRRKEQKSAYRLNLDRDLIDVFAFEDHCQSGLALMRAGEWEKAHEALSEAVTLCAGISLAGIPCGHALGEHVRYLEELLAQAHEARLEALVRLSLREAAGTVPGLRRFIAEYPDRESPRNLLMLALHRAGRHKDAVETFREWRAYLKEEIGAGPGPGIRSLNDRITREDKTLLAEPLGLDVLR
jgi:DNA-binding SARP family transcriptional activator